MEAVNTIEVMRYIGGIEDAHGNVQETWSAPETVNVYSIAPTQQIEPFEEGRDVVVEKKTILAPSNVHIGPHDKVRINTEEYKVDGGTQDWNTGPFGWTPGVSINIEKVSG